MSLLTQKAGDCWTFYSRVLFLAKNTLSTLLAWWEQWHFDAFRKVSKEQLALIFFLSAC